MSGQFKLKIDVGRRAILSRGDLLEALEDVKEHLESCSCAEGTVRDRNGQVVGAWSVTGEENVE